jgi:2-polyprenyl-3-methyl-5-hydroxy-6-metoxy-1,4-benzoquinol methylase
VSVADASGMDTLTRLWGWDKAYQMDGYLFGEEPNWILLAEADRFKPKMKALVIGDGEGRNGVWLARQGLEVLSLDLSEVGLAKARRLAELNGVAIKTHRIDVRDFDWRQQTFDLIVCIFVHFEPQDRPFIHKKMQNALKQGGLLILVAFTRRQALLRTGGPSRTELLYTAEDTLRDFIGLTIHRLEDGEYDLHEGRAHNGVADVLRFVASKT